MSNKFRSKLKEKSQEQEQEYAKLYGGKKDNDILDKDLLGDELLLEDELLEDDFTNADESVPQDLLYHEKNELVDPTELSFEDTDYYEPASANIYEDDAPADPEEEFIESAFDDEEPEKEIVPEIPVNVPPGASVKPPAKKKTSATAALSENQKEVKKAIEKDLSRKGKKKGPTIESPLPKPKKSKDSHDKAGLSSTGKGSFFYISVEVKNALKLRAVLDPNRSMSDHVEAALRAYLKKELNMLGEEG